MLHGHAMALGIGRLRIVPPARAPERGTPALRRAPWALGALAGAVLLAPFALRAGREERALRGLPAEERAALHRRTLDNLRTVCAGDRARDVRDFCRAQAELVLLFPECDAACRAAAREQLRTPTR